MRSAVLSPSRVRLDIGRRRVKTKGITRDAAIARTRRWLDVFIVGMDLCPFAKASLPTLVIEHVGEESTAEAFAAVVARETARLASAPTDTFATTLVVLNDVKWFDCKSWDAFMTVAVARAETVCEGASGDAVVVVPFHPLATWDDDELDLGHYTSRSPLPTVHLLRQSDIERAEAKWYRQEGRADIRERNVEYLRALGADAVREAARRCEG